MPRDDRGMSSDSWTTEHETDPEERGSDFRHDHGYGGCLRVHDFDAVIDRFDSGTIVAHVSCEKCGDWTALVQIDGERSWFLRGHQ